MRYHLTFVEIVMIDLESILLKSIRYIENTGPLLSDCLVIR